MAEGHRVGFINHMMPWYKRRGRIGPPFPVEEILVYTPIEDPYSLDVDGTFWDYESPPVPFFTAFSRYVTRKLLAGMFFLKKYIPRLR